jgi:hypothetical protein
MINMKIDNHIEKIIRAELVKTETSYRQIERTTGVNVATLCQFMQGNRGLSSDSAWTLLAYYGYHLTKNKEQVRKVNKP